MAQLTPEQIKNYYATEGKKTNPLSPLNWLAQQNQTQTVQPAVNMAETPTVSPNHSVPSSITTGSADTYRQQLTDLISGLGTQQQSYLDYIKSQPSQPEIYSQYRTQLGIPEKEATTQALQERVKSTTEMLDQLESDVYARASGKLATAPYLRRQLAVEQKPLTRSLAEQTSALSTYQSGLKTSQEQLADMIAMANAEQERQAGIAKAPYEFTQSLLPTLTNLAQYQTPQEELASLISKERALQSEGLGNYAPSTTTSTTAPPTSYKEWELAGGESGTGKTYSQFIQESSVKPATVAQQTVAGYASRLEQAETTLKSLEKNIQKMNLISFEAQTKFPAALQSAEMQQYMQSARNLINAVLRRESGAVISPSEFSEARKQYLPQPGDTTDTLKQKELNRKVVFENYKKGAGAAYTPLNELIGEENSETRVIGNNTYIKVEGGWKLKQ